MAQERGLSLSEKGFKDVETGELLPVATEEDVYARLDMAWVPPELREGEGEVAAAAPPASSRAWSKRSDIRGDTHTHSNWTDGVDDIEAMAGAARASGLEYMVLTDHSPSLGVTRGLSPERVAEQRAEIDRLNGELSPFRILHGTEMEILADATLDYPDEILATFDVVVASVHAARGQPIDQLTKRALAAIENPHVDIIAHPTGRIVNRREPVSFHWPELFEAAARTGTMLEINGSPRLDLDERLARDAAVAGVRLTLSQRRAPDRGAGLPRLRGGRGPPGGSHGRAGGHHPRCRGAAPMSAVADSRRLLRAGRVRGARTVKRAGPFVLPLILAALVAAGWVVDMVALAGVLALELALAGMGMAALLGAARPAVGYARYAILAVAAVSITLAGRLLPPGIGPLAAPVAWAFLWWTLYTERMGPTAPTNRLSLDLLLVFTVFCAAVGLAGVIPSELWLLQLVLLAMLVAVPCLRAAEARGAVGVPAVGHGALHLLVVAPGGDRPDPAQPAPTCGSRTDRADLPRLERRGRRTGVRRAESRRSPGVRLAGRYRRIRGSLPESELKSR